MPLSVRSIRPCRDSRVCALAYNGTQPRRYQRHYCSRSSAASRSCVATAERGSAARQATSLSRRLDAGVRCQGDATKAGTAARPAGGRGEGGGVTGGSTARTASGARRNRGSRRSGATAVGGSSASRLPLRQGDVTKAHQFGESAAPASLLNLQLLQRRSARQYRQLGGISLGVLPPPRLDFLVHVVVFAEDHVALVAAALISTRFQVLKH